MEDIQHETDVRDRLIAPSDAQHLLSTTGIDDKEGVSNIELRANGPPMNVDPPNAPPWSAYFLKYIYIVLKGLAVVSFAVMLGYMLGMLAGALLAQQPKSENITNWTKQSRNCVVPAHPEHGEYIFNAPTAKPGESFKALKLTVKCLPDYMPQNTYTPSGYLVPGTDPIYCVNGIWSHPLPKCVPFCKLDNNTSIHYRCYVNDFIEGHRTCNAVEPSGTVVSYECSRPNYPFISQPSITCINGSWDHDPDCSQECGRVTSNGVTLMTDGRPAERGELPWHVAIYLKPEEPCPWPCIRDYKLICSGTIVSNNVVISAAHCFWNDLIKKLPASRFAVAAGKIYRDWNNHRDVHAQKSDVKEIHIPDYFQGNAANFQHDIAVVILETPFEYTPFVGHACLSFDVDFEKKQLQLGKLGKVAGWSGTTGNGDYSPILKVVELPYVGIKQCIKVSPRGFIGYITGDKFCAGYGNGKATLCKGDSGAGFVTSDGGRYYLRGIVSTAPSNENLGNIYGLTTFTSILKNEHFIKKYL